MKIHAGSECGNPTGLSLGGHDDHLGGLRVLHPVEVFRAIDGRRPDAGALARLAVDLALAGKPFDGLFGHLQDGSGLRFSKPFIQ